MTIPEPYIIHRRRWNEKAYISARDIQYLYLIRYMVRMNYPIIDYKQSSIRCTCHAEFNNGRSALLNCCRYIALYIVLRNEL